MRLAGAGDFADNPRLDLQYPGNLLKPIVNISVRDGSQIRYTLDGSIPDENATLFTKPFTAQQSAVLTTRSFRPGALPGNILVAPLTVYPLLPAAHPAAKKQGLQLTRYELIPETVKDLDKTTPIGDTVSSRPSINDLSRADNAGLLYTGYVQAPRDALYTWYLSVDDGAVLWIDGQLVIDHDGKHANTEKSGKIALKKGPHVFKLAYIQAGSDKALKLEYSANGIERQELPATAWVHE